MSENSATHQTRRWKRGTLEAGLIILFWGFIFMLNVGQRAIDPRGHQGLTSGQVMHAGFEYMIWLLLTPGIFFLARKFSFEHGRWFRNLFLHLMVAVAVAIMMNYIGHASWEYFIGPMRRGSPTFIGGIVHLAFIDELIVYFTVLAAGIARDYFLRFRDRQEETIRLREEASKLHAQLAEARLRALQMQINPHFLFNTLHAVSSLVERDPRGVRRMIARLSELLRHTLESTGVQEVPLQEELEFLRGYLDIQRIRFQGRLDVVEQVDPDVLDAQVPNLILQPLVENAIKHGVSAIEGVGQLEIRAWRDDEFLHLSVYDNGPGLGASGDGEGTVAEGVGLRNTRARLESLYGSRHSLVLESRDGGGLEARISLPFHRSSDLHVVAVTKR
jgi:two-component system LytT family sensor kinase